MAELTLQLQDLANGAWTRRRRLVPYGSVAGYGWQPTSTDLKMRQLDSIGSVWAPASCFNGFSPRQMEELAVHASFCAVLNPCKCPLSMFLFVSVDFTHLTYL